MNPVTIPGSQERSCARCSTPSKPIPSMTGPRERERIRILDEMVAADEAQRQHA